MNRPNLLKFGSVAIASTWELGGDQIHLGERMWRSIICLTNRLRPLLASLVLNAGCAWAQRIASRRNRYSITVALGDLKGKRTA